MKEIIIYTDGGCRGNDSSKDNVGGLGIVLLYPAKNIVKEYKEGFYNTTNNKMELLAVIKALQMLKERCKVTLYSDSAYVVNAFKQGWIEGWKKKGWTRGKSGELKNKELWIELDQLSKKHDFTIEKVKGHANDKYNNRADELVNQAMDAL
ncbi:ribonuclease HI [Alkalibaculum bacchi]|uniref:ribonuclease H n=1 Tax=Alkalibaculum bacchi TaxID=645887 RepID=A0A366I6S1_9FIRM|nr:ribonuclease HI [Alkalibaculum bacchi]RBP63277.1 ribonuclease HI [Alkalibaculum bacchi]